MAKIPEIYGVGDRGEIDVEELLVILEDMYRTLAIAINRKPDIYTRDTDGQTTDVLLSDGDINVNLSTNKVEMLTNHTSTTAVTWTQLSP